MVRVPQNRETHPDNVSGASFGSKHAENPCPTAYVQNPLPFEQMRVVDDGAPIRPSADSILEHFLVDTYRTESILHTCIEVALHTEMRV